MPQDGRDAFLGLHAKRLPPAASGPLTARPRLLARTKDLLDARLTLIRAPAGFGKTTLMVQWLEMLRHQGVAVAWISLDARDTDPTSLVAQIIFSLEQVTPAISAATSAFAREGGFCDPKVLLFRLIGDVTLHYGLVCLMLDDLHTIGSDAVRSILTLLVERAPANFKLVVASREEGWMSLGRLRAFGQVLELSVDDLRFESGEAAALLTDQGFHSAYPGASEEVADKVEGWVVGLKFAVMTARAAPDHLNRLPALTGRYYAIADFFKEEVLEKQTPEYFDFLLQTSILQRMCASLCNAVTGRRDGEDMLARAHREGLFIFSLDSERVWYRYHHLFGDFLHAEANRRDAARQKVLHGRASRWYEQQGLYGDAFHHLILAGDFDAAGALLARHCEGMFGRGEIGPLFDWAGQLPAEVLASYPVIDLLAVWWLTVEWRFLEAEQILGRAEAQLKAASRGPDEARSIRLRMEHQRINLAIYQEKMSGVSKAAAGLVREFHDAPPYIKATFPLMTLLADAADLRLGDIARRDEEALAHLKAVGAPFPLIWRDTVVGAAYLLAGCPDAASERLRRAISAAERFRGVTGLSSMPAICLARVLYDQDALAEARALIDTHFDTIAYCGIVHQLIFGYVVNARIAQLDGDRGRAEGVIEKGLAFAKTRDFERLRLHMVAEKLRMLADCGYEDELERELRALRVDQDAKPVLPDPAAEAANITEIRALIQVRIAARHAERLPEALALARRWRDFTFRRGAVLSEIQWRLASAELLCLEGDERQAGREIGQAVLIAAPRGLRRCFLDMGEPVTGRLKALALASHPNPVIREFLDPFNKLAAPEAVGACRLEPTSPLGPLSARELTILQYVSRGYLNREIAEQLCLAEGSVKWHLHGAFQKLGVSKRRQAIEKARAFGFI